MHLHPIWKQFHRLWSSGTFVSRCRLTHFNHGGLEFFLRHATWFLWREGLKGVHPLGAWRASLPDGGLAFLDVAELVEFREFAYFFYPLMLQILIRNAQATTCGAHSRWRHLACRTRSRQAAILTLQPVDQRGTRQRKVWWSTQGLIFVVTHYSR